MNGKIKIVKLCCMVLVVSTLAGLFCGCGSGSVSNAYRNVNGAIPGSQILAENRNYRLEWDADGKTVILKSVTTGDYWSDILYESFKAGSSSATANSPVSITVANTRSLKWETVTSYSQLDGNGSIICKKTENGIRVTYFFDRYKIAVPIDYTLKEDCLNISLNSSKILEDGTDYKLVAVSVAPFLCSVKNDAENGGVFVPAGCGAVMYSDQRTGGTRKYTGEVYGDDGARRNPTNLTNSESVKLPVFGTFESGKGIMGIIEKSAGSVQLEAQAGNEKTGYSNIAANFFVRGYDDFIYTYHGRYQGVTRRVNSSVSGQTLSISFYPLAGEDAGYAGMAKKYREYLIKNGMLEKSDDTGSPYSVTFLGGTNITKSAFGIPYKELTALSTFSQVENIIDDISNKTGVMPYVRMLGFGDNGALPGKIAGGKTYPTVFGSKNELTGLLKLSDKTKLFFDYDIVNFSKSGGGFSLNLDVAKTAILHKAEHFPVNAVRVNVKNSPYYTVSRNSLTQAFDFAVKKAKRYNIGQVCFSSLGQNAFSDFSDDSYINKNNMESDVKKLFESAAKSGLSVATANANSYAAGLADAVFDTPTDNGRYNAFDLEIPFYQMVFHSYKPLYTSAVNLEDNIPLATAKAAAYGMGIGYCISNGYVEESDDLEQIPLYGLVYDDNKEKIREVLKNEGYIELYSAIADAPLSSYEMINASVSRSVFGNGSVIYVNHTSENADCPSGSLAAYEYRIER